MQHLDTCKIIERISIHHCNKQLREILFRMEEKLSINNINSAEKARKETIKRYPCCEKYL